MDMNLDAIGKTELPRMQKVMRNFELYRYVEMAGLVVGLMLLFYAKNNVSKQLWYGLGTGLAAQFMVLLVFDGLAEHRSKKYAAGLTVFLNAVPKMP